MENLPPAAPPTPQEIIERLKEKLALTESRASNAERRLEAAKSELLVLSVGEPEPAPEPKAGTNPQLQERVEKLEEEKEALSEQISQLKTELDTQIEAVAHWRGRYLQTEIDKDSEAGRADLAEEMLTQAVQPVPRDEEILIREREMAWLALKDKITGLPNGNQLDLSLEQRLRNARSSGDLVLLILLKLDGFQGHNEFVGWNGGNELLTQVGERIKGNLSETTTLTRRSGNTFALLTSLERPQGAAATIETPLVRARQIADFLLQTLSNPFELSGQRLPVTCSIGMSLFPDNADTPEEMLENAYVALHEARKAGGAQYALYNDKLYADKEHRASLAAELRRAVESSSLKMLFRPVADTQRGSLAAGIVEPFWEHPAHGRVGQNAFFPIAEEQGVGPLVVDQIISAACELSRKMRGSVPIIMRFPASALRQAEFVRHLMNRISQARIKPESLIVELPSEALLRMPGKVRAFFSELSRWRLGRCIGRLGDGPGDIAALQSCQPSLLALAEGLMENAPAHDGSKTLVLAHLDLARRLGLPTLVEGTRDSSQAHFLALHEANYVAGDFLSPSLTLDDFVNRRRTTWTLK